MKNSTIKMLLFVSNVRSPIVYYLRFGETELGREFDSLRCGEVLLNIEALLQSVELRIAEDGSGLASADVLGQVVDGADGGTDHAWTCGADVM